MHANLRRAFIDRETVKIGGGEFTPEECRDASVKLRLFPLMLYVLLGAEDLFSAADGTSVEKEKLIAAYRDLLEQVKGYCHETRTSQTQRAQRM